MKFIPKRYTLESEKNGTVEVFEWLWMVNIHAGGFEQSGPYVSALWKYAVQYVPAPQNVRDVLVIGLGLGGSVRAAERMFPHARVVAIEWDKTIIGLASRYDKFRRAPHIIHGDIRDVLPACTEQFDVILSDAFYGDTPDVGADTNAVGQALAHILSPHGLYILNASRTSDATAYISRYLTLKKTRQFRDNRVAFFTR